VKVGIHFGMSNETYHASPGLSRSRLKLLLTDPPLAFHAAPPVVETAAMRKGTAGHLAVLEPERFAAEVRPRPTFSGKGSVAARAEWEEENAGKIIIAEDDYANLCAVAKLIRSKKGPATALREGAVEAAIFWDAGGVLVKAKPDFLSVERGLAVDLKFTDKPLSDRTIVSILEDQFACLQASMVVAGVQAVTGKSVAAYLLACNPNPPADFRLVLVGDLNGEASDLDWLERGDAQLAEALRIYRACKASGEWPGWCDLGVSRVPMPSWLKSRTEELTKQAQESAA